MKVTVIFEAESGHEFDSLGKALTYLNECITGNTQEKTQDQSEKSNNPKKRFSRLKGKKAITVSEKKCVMCGKKYKPGSNIQKYCYECKAKIASCKISNEKANNESIKNEESNYVKHDDTEKSFFEKAIEESIKQKPESTKEPEPNKKIPPPGSYEEKHNMKNEAEKALGNAKSVIKDNETIISIPAIKATFTVNRKMTKQEINEFKKQRVHEYYGKWDKLKKK